MSVGGRLVAVTNGETTLRFTATFGKNKSVQLNQFLGKIYIHLSSPSGDEDDEERKKTFSMSTSDFKQLCTLLNSEKLTMVETTFNQQVRILYNII